jgi:hypothetical protein
MPLTRFDDQRKRLLESLDESHAAYHKVNECDWAALKKVFCGIRCMKTGTSLVGNSKVMAHLLPNLIPPVDREYTLRFLLGSGQITNGIDIEWTTLAEILDDFFYPVISTPLFQQKAVEWLAQSDRSKWDSSQLKIVDNLVIGLLKIMHVPPKS